MVIGLCESGRPDLRVVATIMTLPDVGWNGFQTIQESREVQAMRVLDRATAFAATASATRTSNAGRIARLQDVAEKANLRAQLRTEQIRAVLRLDLPDKGAGVGSAVLLVREEYRNDDRALHTLARRLQVHCMAIGR